MHIDHLLVVGLKNDANLNIEHIIAPQKHPAASAGQNLASQFGTVEAAACEACDASRAVGCLAERENRHFVIFDEPTASLTPEEKNHLLRVAGQTSRESRSRAQSMRRFCSSVPPGKRTSCSGSMVRNTSFSIYAGQIMQS
jgi:hypothetical protein